ncbi:MAG: molybdopterin cofactor-binding domain-containing protein [Halocynthiibacter sp.]
MGGGIGGRVPCQASEAAARLSAATGLPVRLQWDRETDFQNNYFQPIFLHHIDAGVTADGIISHWDHGIESSSIFTGVLPKIIGQAMDMASADEQTQYFGVF